MAERSNRERERETETRNERDIQLLKQLFKSPPIARSRADRIQRFLDVPVSGSHSIFSPAKEERKRRDHYGEGWQTFAVKGSSGLEMRSSFPFICTLLPSVRPPGGMNKEKKIS